MPNTCVTFDVLYRFGGLIDGGSALGVAYNVSLMVVIAIRAG